MPSLSANKTKAILDAAAAGNYAVAAVNCYTIESILATVRAAKENPLPPSSKSSRGLSTPRPTTLSLGSPSSPQAPSLTCQSTSTTVKTTTTANSRWIWASTA